ncbi:MAG: HDOD domain-containing protein, partial [Gammaproteobacteria bacterium]|nr:HDOD domain-containing protein [Gammaproteobacteria bacterium]
MALDAERIVTNVLKVAALPAVAIKFSEAIKNPLTSNQDLEKIVSEDSALAAKVLMISNSALFNFPSKI